MTEYIGCRKCDSPDCKGCNLKNLETMLNNGKFDCLMNGNRCINPSADVAPVRHGRWIPFNESEISGFNPELAGCDPIAGYRCSKCGAEAILDCNDQFVLSKYCYDCGAKMDGDEE